MRDRCPNANGNRAGAQPEIYIIVMAHLNLANETASDDNDGLFTVEQPMDLMTVNARPSRFKSWRLNGSCGSLQSSSCLASRHVTSSIMAAASCCGYVAALASTAFCGSGRGIRVSSRSSGLDDLPYPSQLESATLAAIGANRRMRLACRIRPSENLGVVPLLTADHLPANTIVQVFTTPGEPEIAVSAEIDVAVFRTKDELEHSLSMINLAHS